MPAAVWATTRDPKSLDAIRPAGGHRRADRRLPGSGQAIGLKVVLRPVQAQDYIEYFSDPEFPAGVDGFPGVTYGDDTAPEAMLG